MSLKQIVYSISFFLVLLPFILMTDLFPFLRFAMFAEPVEKIKNAEMFFVTNTVQGKEFRFNPEKYELQEESFQYLLRNYFYRGQSEALLKKLNTVDSKQQVWKLYQVTFPVANPDKKDTVMVATFK